MYVRVGSWVNKPPITKAAVAITGTSVFAAGGKDREPVTFQQLDEESDCVAFGLEQAGIGRGMRTILMVRPSLEFFTLVFAMFKVGCVPVVVDPGMGIKRMLSCFQECTPTAFIGIPLAHVVRTLYPKFFKSSKYFRGEDMQFLRRRMMGLIGLRN